MCYAFSVRNYKKQTVQQEFTSSPVRKQKVNEMIGVLGDSLLPSRWSPRVIDKGRPGFTRPQPEMPCQLYGSWEYMRTMLGAMWSFLQACKTPVVMLSFTALRRPLSARTKTHIRWETDSPPTSGRLETHNPLFKRFHAVWVKTGLF